MVSKSHIWLFSAMIVGIIALACSSPAAPPTPAPTPQSTATPQPTATPEPTATLEPTATPEPTATNTPEPGPTPEVQALFQYSSAVQLLRSGFHDEAVPQFSIVIRMLPDFAQAYHGRGLAYFRSEEHPSIQNALEDFNTAIEKDPELGDAYISRALLYIEEEDEEAAIADLEKAISVYHEIRQAREIAAAKALLEQVKSGGN